MTTFKRNPLDGHDDRVVTAIWSEIESVPDIMSDIGVDLELKSRRDILNAAIAAAHEALMSGRKPSSTDETIHRVFAERTRRPLHPRPNSYVPAAQAFFAEVGEEIAKHDALTRNLLDTAEEMRERGLPSDNQIVGQLHEVLALAESGQLPAELDELVRETWSRCHQGPKVDYAAEQTIRDAVGVASGDVSGADRITEMETTRTILSECGQGIRIERIEGVPDRDAHVLDPAAMRSGRGLPAI